MSFPRSDIAPSIVLGVCAFYGTPDCHHSRDRPKTKREIVDGLKPQYKLSNTQRGLMKCSDCHKP